jgi:hypothetical protein
MNAPHHANEDRGEKDVSAERRLIKSFNRLEGLTGSEIHDKDRELENGGKKYENAVYEEHGNITA